LPASVLAPLLPPGLTLDTHGHLGFVAVALVQTRRLRPVFLPNLVGQDFFLAGYRIFVRYRTQDGRTLRGLRILRSDTNRRTMVYFGNRLTHYNYQLADADCRRDNGKLTIQIKTPDSEADLIVSADLASCPLRPPPGSPFTDLSQARRFAGPLPFTFDYEAETHSVIMIRGIRQHWKPRPVQVEVLRNTFFEAGVFQNVHPVLANAFYVENIPYRWQRGVVERLP